MKNYKNIERQGLTLIELVTVVVIIGILVMIAIPNYYSSKDKVLNRGAQAIMSLIRAAERAYRLNTGSYYPSSGSVTSVVSINGNLSLDLVDDGKWSYSISSSQGFFANMTRYIAGNPYTWWWINSTMINASCGGQCVI